jgi:hypothetical protein
MANAGEKAAGGDAAAAADDAAGGGLWQKGRAKKDPLIPASAEAWPNLSVRRAALGSASRP